MSNKVAAATCTPSAADVAHHGKVVVEAQHCAACHGDDLSGSDGAGGSTVFAANITSDRETGIGAWSTTQLAAAITTGVNEKDGTLCSQMPRFANPTDDEVKGVAAYLAKVPAVKHQVPESVCASEQLTR